MGNTKRWYIYVTSAVGLQALTWAVITLLRNMVIESIKPNTDEIAYQIAIILVGLPIYIVHWLWAQRLAQGNKEDKGSFPRCLYLYLVLAGALGPILNNIYGLFAAGVVEGIGSAYLMNLIPIVILAVVFAYHNRVLNEDIRNLDGRVGDPTVRRLYGLFFTAVGLVITAMAAYSLLFMVFHQVGSQLVQIGINKWIWQDVIRLVLGLIVWVVSWNWMQRLFKSSKEEQTSTARRVYLYLLIFISVLTSISVITRILASLIKRILISRGSSGASSGDIRDALPVLIIMGVIWAYHAFVISEDDESVGTVQAQEGVRRTYLYLIAGIGFAAFITGIAGVLNDLIYSMINQSLIGNEIREALSYNISMIIAGIFTWIIPWRSIQTEVVEKDTMEVRRFMPRRIYLYLYLFISMMTLLGSLVFIVYQILLSILGQRGDSDWSGAISGSIVAAGVLAFHGSILGADGRKLEEEKKSVLANMRIAIIDGGEGYFGSALKKTLVEELPGLEPAVIGLTKNAKLAMDTKVKDKDIPAILAEAKLIIGPWNALADFEGVAPKIAKAVAASPAQKLLLPVRSPGCDWVGLGKLEENTLVPKTIKAVKQIIAGEEVVSKRPIGCAAILGIIVGLLFLLAFISFFLMW